MAASDSNNRVVDLGTEPKETSSENTYTGSCSHDDNATTEEQLLSAWDEETWATKITKLDNVQESKAKLERRVSEFLLQADPVEKKNLEAERTEMLEAMRAAQDEQAKKYPEMTDQSIQTRRQRFQAKVKASCRTFSEVIYEYSKIMDLLANSAPEYVALAWGAIKIILVVQINYEELKQKVRTYLEQIKIKFEIIDHLTAYLPRANLVVTVARAYELFSRFLAKAVKYYTLNRFKATWRAIKKPWKIQLQGLVDEIDQTFVNIKDIAQCHGLIEGHTSLAVGRENLQVTRESIVLHEQALAKLSDLENMMEQVHSTIIRFTKEQDVKQTADLLRQYVDDSIRKPERHQDYGSMNAIFEENIDLGTAVSRTDTENLESLYNEVFVELREFNDDQSRSERALEQSSGMRAYRTSKRNEMKIETIKAWIESSSSQLLWIDGNTVLDRSQFSLLFAGPLVLLGKCNYETLLILRHDCGDHPSYDVKTYHLLVQALLFQVFEQHPEVLGMRKASLTREKANSITALWELFLNCLKDVNAHCTFIIIDNIDILQKGNGTNAQEGRLLLQKLDALGQDRTRITKIMLIASLVTDRTFPSNAETALMKHHPRGESDKTQEEMTFVSHKLMDIQNGRCKTISFADLNLLYLPYTTVYAVEDEGLQAFIVLEVSGEMGQQPFESYSPLRLRAWSIDHDGKEIARRYHDLSIPPFSGQKAIASLRYIPSGYLPGESKKRTQLVARGEAWWYYSTGTHHVIEWINRTQAIVSQQHRPMADTQPEEFQGSFSRSERSALKPIYLLLCPLFIKVFLLQELQWTTMKVHDIGLYVYDSKHLDRLVTTEENRRILTAICDVQMKDTSRQSNQNFGKKNGSGLVILLHGPPGSGKTFTCACVADSTQSPLIALTAESMGMEPSIFRSSFRKYMMLAREWGAIVLLDDTEIFMEQRQHLKAASKELVSVLLRELETYPGIFFITTSRVGRIDEAFTSRVHVKLYYPNLVREQQCPVWENMLAALEHERKDMRIDPSALEYFKAASMVAERVWNTREIRNAFQMAVALADSDSETDEHGKIVLRDRHIQQIVLISRNFTRYLDEVHGVNMTERARQGLLRNDNFKPELSKHAKNESV